MFWALILSSAFAADLSFSGKVLSLQKDTVSDVFKVKIQGISSELTVVRGPNYKCLREGLNSQDVLLYSFDSRSMRIQSCEVLGEL